MGGRSPQNPKIKYEIWLGHIYNPKHKTLYILQIVDF
jgi:hypothetical protein